MLSLIRFYASYFEKFVLLKSSTTNIEHIDAIIDRTMNKDKASNALILARYSLNIPKTAPQS